MVVVRGPSERSAQVGELGGEPGAGLPLARAVPQRHDFGFSLREVAGVRGTDLRPLHRERPVVPRRTAGSSPASKTGYGQKSGPPQAATCAPKHPADPARRSHRCHRIRQPRKHFRVRTRLKRPNSGPGASFRLRRGGRRTTAQRGVASDDVPGRAGSRRATGTGGRVGPGCRRQSLRTSGMPPARLPTESRRGAGRSRSPRPADRPRSRARHCGLAQRTSRQPCRLPKSAPATAAHRLRRVLHGWWRLSALSRIAGGWLRSDLLPHRGCARSCRIPATGLDPPAPRPPTP